MEVQMTMETTITKSYSELIQFNTFEERYRYLKLDGILGEITFGYDRYLNQVLYTSAEWKRTRNEVILRDNACDLAFPGHDIYARKYVIIHHMNPITKEMILNRDPLIFEPEYLITTTLRTHNAIHYGDENQISHDPIVRTANDTVPWKKGV